MFLATSTHHSQPFSLAPSTTKYLHGITQSSYPLYTNFTPCVRPFFTFHAYQHLTKDLIRLQILRQFFG